MANAKKRLALVIGFAAALALLIVISGCRDDSSASPEPKKAVESCGEGEMLCFSDCIPLDSCCTSNDCDKGFECVNNECVNPCENVTCEGELYCSNGECVCPEGLKQCGDACIPEAGCCSQEDCSNTTVCFNNQCVEPCQAVQCSDRETCVGGECVCRDNYVRSVNGNCIEKGLCAADEDCEETQKCESGICVENCYSYKEPVEISECFFREALRTGNVETCEFVKEDKRNRCVFEVAVKNKERSLCFLLPVSPPASQWQYNRQLCVIEVAKVSQNPDLCRDTPKWTNLDPPDRDAYCRQKVVEYIESLTIKDIEECGDSCGCRYRFALRTGPELCSKVCPENRSSCLNEFYEG